MSEAAGGKIDKPLRILLDQNIPRQVRTTLAGYEIKTALQMGWDTIENGNLLDAAETAGFDVFITADQNLQYQQRLAGRRIALVVLTTNKWEIIRREADKLVLLFPQSGLAASRTSYLTVLPFVAALDRRLPLYEQRDKASCSRHLKALKTQRGMSLKRLPHEALRHCSVRRLTLYRLSALKG